MPLIAEARADRLISLTRERFDADLREVELQVLRHSCNYGDPPNWVASKDGESESSDTLPSSGSGRSSTGRPLDSWNGPALRPSLLRWLLTDPDATVLLGPRGLRVWNARLIDPLDLTLCRVPVRLELRYCFMEASLLLDAADLHAFSIRNSTLQCGLAASGLRVHGSLSFEDVVAADTLRFNNSTIEGSSQFAETKLTADVALDLDGASIADDLLLWPKFESSGMVSLESLCAGGSLIASDAILTATPISLTLNFASIRRNALLNGGFQAVGKIQVANAQIDGALFCDGASLTGTEDAISISTTKIRGDVLLNHGFNCAGRILFLGAEIGGQLNCKRAALKTLVLSGSKIRGHTYLDEGFTSSYLVDLDGMELTGRLLCNGASIKSLSVVDTTIAQAFLWTNILNPDEASLRLLNVSMESLRDDQPSWPRQNNLTVNGLAVGDFYLHKPLPGGFVDPDPLHGTERIAWLSLQGGANVVESQPWLHVAKLLEEKGYRRAAKRYIFALRKQESAARRKNTRFQRLGRTWDLAFSALEEQPFRILISIAFCVALGTALFWPLQGHFAPTSETDYKRAYPPDGKPGALPVAYPEFAPPVYALENNLPIVKLGQDDRWAPDSRHCNRLLYWLLMVMRWFLILAGWAQGVVLAAAVSARFRN